jgi:hypothetical protein
MMRTTSKTLCRASRIPISMTVMDHYTHPAQKVLTTFAATFNGTIVWHQHHAHARRPQHAWRAKEKLL